MTNSKKFWKESFFGGISGLGDFFIELKTFAEIIKRTAAIKMVVKISCLSGSSAIKGNKENHVKPCSMGRSRLF